MTEPPDMTACFHWYPAAMLSHGGGRALQCEGCLIRNISRLHGGGRTQRGRLGANQHLAGRLKLKLQRRRQVITALKFLVSC